jgi:protein-S-isoprenylcysteine O-methyltransferase Ste14
MQVARVGIRIVQLLVLVLIQSALLFVSAGTVRWPAGWWYIGLYVLMLAGASLVMIPRRREVIEERSRGMKGGKSWDLWITRLMAIPTLGLLAVTGLDQRWSWTPPLPNGIRLSGGLLFILGYLLVLWAMYVNKYFSQVVRIQTERDHHAITAGPYRMVRHPGYLGMIASMLGAVFILDSLYGLICFALYLALIVTRTALEDHTLHAELPGYSDYSAHTRYRLIPGLW